MMNEIIKVKCRVKWFNQFKGYGFVEASGVADDIFLHFSVLGKSGIEKVNNDDLIMCEIMESSKGYHVVSIIEILHINKYPLKEHKPYIAEADIKWFNPSKGFGFAQLESGEDVFIHSNLLKKYKMFTIEPGEKINLLVHYTNLGYEAIDIIV